MVARTLHNVNDVSTILMRTPGKPGDLTSVLQHIAQTAQNFFATDACVVLAINPITGGFLSSQTVAENLQKKHKLSHTTPGPGGITQQVLKDDGVLLVQDLRETSEYHSPFTRQQNIRAYAGLALRTRHRKRPLGVIYLDYKQSKVFSSTDYESFRIFAVQASFLLQETWLAHHFEEVARIGQEVNHDLATVDELFQKLQTYVDAVLDDSHTLLLAIYQPQTNTLDLHIRKHGHSIFMNGPLEDAYKYVLETQKPCFIQQLSKEVGELPFQMSNNVGFEQLESYIFVPLTLCDISLGVLSIQHPLPNAYGQEDQFMVQLLATHIALALHNMRLYSNLSRLNETGQLLTRQLESEQTLQATVDKIRDATQADIVVLYPYEPDRQRFVLPPRRSGTLLNSPIQSLSPSQPDDIAGLMLRRGEPIFANESTTLYHRLLGEGQTRQGNFAQREKIRSTAVVPLQVGDQSVGVLFVNFRQTQYFDAPQKKLIDGLTNYAAIAIKNSRAFGTLSQRRVRELEILQHIDLELNRTLDLEAVLSTLLKLANEHVHAEEASILLRNPRIQALEIPTALGLHAEDRRIHIISLQETKGITRWVFEHKKPARVNNVLCDIKWRDIYIPSEANTISELDIPLLDGEEVVGVLNFESSIEGAFWQEDEDFLMTLAGQAVLAIKNAQAYEREKRLVEEGQVLNQISKEITSQLDHVRVFNLILDEALELTHSTLGSLHLYDPNQKELYMVAEHGVAKDKKGYRQKLGEGIVGYVARHRQLQNVEDVMLPPWNLVYQEFFPGARSELTVPMLAGNELRGVLNVESPSPNNFSESDERLLQGLADLAVVAVQNAQAYEREKRLAEEGQILNQISKEITSQLDHMRVFDLILEKALESTHSNMGNLMLYDLDMKDLWMAAERNVTEDKKGQHQSLDQGVVGYVARNKQLCNVDLSQHPWNEIYLDFFPGARSELAAPMLAGDELRGVLNVESPLPNNFTESDERLLQGLADLAVVALQQAEHYQKAEREALRFALLYRAGQELGKITEWTQLEEAYDVILHIAEEHSQSQVVIRRYDEDTQELVVVRASDPRYIPLLGRKNLDIGINGQVACERRTIVIHDTNKPPAGVVSAQLSDPTTRSLFITPIIFKDRYYGNLMLRHKMVGYFQGTDKQFFEGLAQQLASTIYRLETVQARQEFEQRALAAEEMSSIGEIAFGLTHRLDNDLGLVESYVNDIRRELGATNGIVSGKLESIKRAVRKVLDMSEALKGALAKSGDVLASEPIPITPKLLLEEARLEAIPSLPSTIEIDLEIDEDVACIHAIPRLVMDILDNLISNAIQAMPDGGTITLKARNIGRSVALEVTDTGIGIPLPNQGKIFGLFYTTKRSFGFGLWNARRNALKNGGDLKVLESHLGQGTTFRLLLPRIDCIA